MRKAALMSMTALLMLGAACGKDEAVGPPTEASIVGVYNLTIVNGGPLPFPIAGNETSILELIAGKLTLKSDHTFIDEITTRQTYASGTPTPIELVDTRTGTFALTGTTVLLSYPEGVSSVAATGNLLHANNGGLLLTYTK